MITDSSEWVHVVTLINGTLDHFNANRLVKQLIALEKSIALDG